MRKSQRLSKTLLRSRVKPLKGYRVVHQCGHAVAYQNTWKRKAEILAHQECPICLAKVANRIAREAEAQ